MTNQPRFFRQLLRRPRLWGLLCGLTLAVAQLFTGVGAGTAQAATTTCTYGSGTQTCTVTFTNTGAAQSWTVPAGVTQATFVVDGAQGGTGQLAAGTQGTGGLGARAQATLAVSAGQSYQLMVGGTGSVTAGGFNGGGAGGASSRNFNGAGGGGASDVRNGACAATLSCTLADRRIIAGGGGGGASLSGNGGSGGQLGGNGTGSSSGGTAGTGGTATSGGTGGGPANGGSTPGAAGQLGLGGAGGFAGCGCGGPGGGGGGLYGGGGGGWEGGGGGGSSFGPAGVTFQSGVRTGNGQIAITYTQPDTTKPVANPTLSPAPNAAGWNKTNVTVNWNWTDNLTGIDPANCTTTTSVTSEGSQTLTATCRDRAGNANSASVTVKLDKTAPLITGSVSPQANGFGWNNSTVTVSFTCQEQGTGSGLATNTVGGNVTMTTQGAYPAVTNTGSCVDVAGNGATAVTVGPFNIDLTKPTISAAATTQPNTNGWYNSNVTIHFTCADALSDIATCPSDQTLSSEGAAVASSALTARDKADNVSNASNIVTVKIDKTAPSVLVTGVTEGATYNFGSVPMAGCSTTDALSDVATQATLNTTGGNSDGSGSFTATCSGATDLAGNSAAPVSVHYTVGPPPTATPPPTPTPTNTATDIPTALPTNTPTDTPTNTAVPPSATPTDTPTNTAVPPSATPTDTPTNTAVPPPATNTPVAPTATPTVPATSLYATVQQVRSTLAALLPSGNSKTDQALRNAIAKLDQSLSPDFWLLPEGNRLSSQGEKAFHRLRDAIKELRNLKAPPATVAAALNSLTRVGRTLAEQAIAAATAAGGNAKQLTQANKEMTKAQKELDKQRPDLAFGHYEEAWQAAQAAMGVTLAASEPDDPATTDDVHDDVAEPVAPDQNTQTNLIFLPAIKR